MFVIGITGGIGSGKTLAARYCASYGVPVIDADEISRNVTASGGSAIEEIRSAFGDALIDTNGGLNREKMSKLVFKNKKSLDKLSAIVHKHVVEEMNRQVEEMRAQQQKVLILDVPIPVRIGFLDVCDQVWVVWADPDTRILRLENRGMTREESIRRMKCQMTREEYSAIADHIIENNSTAEELQDKVGNLLENECRMRGIKIKQS